MMQRLDKKLSLNAGTTKTAYVLVLVIVFACCAMGYGFVLAAGRQDAPSNADSQNVGGVWLGQLSEKMADGRVGHGSLYMRLRQSGDRVSGVAGDSEKSASPIADAALSGNHLEFSVTTAGGAQGGVLLKIELDANGDTMEGKGHALRSGDDHAWDVVIKVERKK